MAGLQYKFFPTDFLYPKKPKTKLSIDFATRNVVNLPDQTRNQNVAKNIEVLPKTLAHSSLHENN
ncbi:hypothetical protein PanWU01x14_357830 [Parasponia andersonii]|uniref:Uncharacterized protein n=1 Tax=Parasponia andersonii TaxID=3476 RepID=A0A2P5A8I0_PARAD|nr:hypothetical protein PanWU01x14_357830 [Parasponia andersonii]